MISLPLRRAKARRLRSRGTAPAAAHPPQILVVTAAVGAGHDGAAHELARRLRIDGAEVVVHDYLDALPGWGRWLAQDCYMPAVQHTPWFFEWLFRSIEQRAVIRGLVVFFCRLAERDVRRWARGADVVVSTFPLASKTLGRLRARGILTVPAVTFITDPSTHELWCHPAVDVHLCVTDATAADGSRYGVRLLATGALTEPRFSRQVAPADRERLRRRLGVAGAEPIALISAGSLGLGQVPASVEAVLAHPEARALVLCGRNEELRAGFDGQPRVIALGWRDDVPELMAAADILVHNAGGLSFTEALVAGLPAVTYLAIPGHGRANAAVLAGAGLASWPATTAELVEAIDRSTDRPYATRRPIAQGDRPDAAAVVLGMVDPGTVRRDASSSA